jgi:hypothetical protein
VISRYPPSYPHFPQRLTPLMINSSQLRPADNLKRLLE